MIAPSPMLSVSDSPRSCLDTKTNLRHLLGCSGILTPLSPATAGGVTKTVLCFVAVTDSLTHPNHFCWSLFASAGQWSKCYLTALEENCHVQLSRSACHWMLALNQFGATPHTMARWTAIPDWLVAPRLRVVMSTWELVDSDLRPNLKALSLSMTSWWSRGV